MKLTSTFVLLFCIISSLNAQSVTADFYPGNEVSNSSQFPLYEGVLTSTGNTYQFGTVSQVTFSNPVGFSLSDNLKMIGALQKRNGLSASIYNYEGKEIVNTELDYINASDETIGFTLLDTGEFVVRDNVANFSFFDAAGNRAFTYSNSAQAAGGEQTSEIAVSDDGIIKVAYNPVIQYDNSRGSRISIVTGDREADQIFASQNRVITNLSVSSADNSISVVTDDRAGSRQIHWFDRFGNLLFEMEAEGEVNGFSVTDDGNYFTIYSGNRVQVYNRDTLERLGSATSRSKIVQASYFPDRNLIVALGGQVRNQEIANPIITVIDVQQRQIDHAELSESISFRSQSHITINNDESNIYRVDGVSRPIRITAQF